jgi:hypothetical protein
LAHVGGQTRLQEVRSDPKFKRVISGAGVAIIPSERFASKRLLHYGEHPRRLTTLNTLVDPKQFVNLS